MHVIVSQWRGEGRQVTSHQSRDHTRDRTRDVPRDHKFRFHD